jgi:hypothetical protein
MMTNVVVRGSCGAVVRRSLRSKSTACFWLGAKTPHPLSRYMKVGIVTGKEQRKRYHNDIEPSSSSSMLAILASVGAVHFWNTNENTTKAESSKCLNCELDHLGEERYVAASCSTARMSNQAPEQQQMARRVTGTPSQHGHCSHCHQGNTNPMTIDNDEDDEDEDPKDIPPYVDRMHASALGGALDHRVALKDEAKYLLLSEDVYPVEKAQLTFAPRVPPPIQRRHPAS